MWHMGTLTLTGQHSRSLETHKPPVLSSKRTAYRPFVECGSFQPAHALNICLVGESEGTQVIDEVSISVEASTLLKPA